MSWDSFEPSEAQPSETTEQREVNPTPSAKTSVECPVSRVETGFVRAGRVGLGRVAEWLKAQDPKIVWVIARVGSNRAASEGFGDR